MDSEKFLDILSTFFALFWIWYGAKGLYREYKFNKKKKKYKD